MTRLNDVTDTIRQAHISYFLRGQKANKKLWSRLGDRPNLPDKVLLDIGRRGAFLVMRRLRGAKRVVGIDKDPERIDFATAYLAERFPDLVGRVEFFCCELKDLKEQSLALILSKDSLRTHHGFTHQDEAFKGVS